MAHHFAAVIALVLGGTFSLNNCAGTNANNTSNTTTRSSTDAVYPAAPQSAPEPAPARAAVTPGASTADASAPKPNVSPSGVRLLTLARNLPKPWGLAPLPDGRFLISTKAGSFLLLAADGTLVHTISAGLPPQLVEVGQGGLLDVIADTDFAQNRRIYFCFAEQDSAQPERNGTALATAQLSADNQRLEHTRVLYRQLPKVQSSGHFGCRIVQVGQQLYMGMGDRQTDANRVLAQDLSTGHGKVIRINTDGSVPADNPFVKTPRAQAATFTYGHRNIQGATLGPDGAVWISEHGPQGGDEINRLQAGANYGWPVITHGEEYGGGQLGEGSAKPGMMQPLKYWVPSIAPAGLVFLTSSRYGAWRGKLFSGALRAQSVRHMQLQDGRITSEGRIDIGERVRDLRQGPDGYLYLITDGANARLIRLEPRFDP